MVRREHAGRTDITAVMDMDIKDNCNTGFAFFRHL